VVIGLAALLQAGSSAWAQERTPSPQELWEAYPLEPDQAPATATPSAEFRAGPSATPKAAPPDDGGMPWLLVLLLAAPPVFAAGLLIGRRRHRAPSAPPVAAEPPRRFQWRDYPEPARPAPPPPPPPPVPGARPKQKEPH
jgi:hypothetical protein